MKNTLVLALYIPLRFEAQHYSEFRDILLFMRSQEFWKQKVHVLEKKYKSSSVWLGQIHVVIYDHICLNAHKPSL